MDFFDSLSGANAIGNASGLSSQQQDALFMAMGDGASQSCSSRILAALRERFGYQYTDRELISLYNFYFSDDDEEEDDDEGDDDND